MTATFCFKIKRNGKYSATFHSTDGEEYIVECNDSNLYLKWTQTSTKFIKVSTYDETSMEVCCENIQYITNNIHNLQPFHIGSSRVYYDSNYGSGFVIAILVIPYVPSTDISNSKPCGAVSDGIKNTPVMEKKLEQLSTDLKNLLQTGELSDVVLTDGTDEIHAHKIILSIRSSVFAKMFQHPRKKRKMNENNENRITIEDITIPVLRELLHFMYTGTIIIKDSKMARNLYIAADKYDVKELRDICSSFLKSVDLNNVLDTLLLADLYSDKNLKDTALYFLANNYSRVKALTNWTSFLKENQTLAIEILSFVIDTKTAKSKMYPMKMKPFFIPKPNH